MSIEQDPSLQLPEPVEQIEPQNETVVLQRTRHELAQAYGLDVAPDPVELTSEQEAEVLAGFAGSFAERTAKAKQDARAAGFDDSIVSDWDSRRYNTSALSALRGAGPNETFLVMSPRDKLFAGNPVDDKVAGSSAFAVAQRAVTGAAKALGLSDDELKRYAESASAQVFSSPHNGAPIITQRTIETPAGTIREMSLHGAGSPDVIDTQVAVVKK